METRIDRARPDDVEAVARVLAAHRLPLDGLREHVGTMLVARRGEEIVGSAAVEIYSDGALLRSVAVLPELQGHDVGRRLTDAAIDLARERQVSAIYLLTTTAERYFPRFGFETVTRADVPAGVQTSVEFRSACPASATVMCKRLP
jgi:amino-acid N-acetyltransferase